MQITLYTNRCPCCEVLEAALKAASLDFETVTDTGQMLAMGMTHLPMLCVCLLYTSPSPRDRG